MFYCNLPHVGKLIEIWCNFSRLFQSIPQHSGMSDSPRPTNVQHNLNAVYCLTKWPSGIRLPHLRFSAVSAHLVKPQWLNIAKILVQNEGIHSRSLTARLWKMMLGRLLSLWDGTFSGAMLNFGGVHPKSWNKHDPRPELWSNHLTWFHLMLPGWSIRKTHVSILKTVWKNFPELYEPIKCKT